MPALLTDLINQASDPAVKTADLLRKAKVIAHRLQLSDQLAWIDLEQRGYRESDPLPLYRFIRAPVYLRDVRTGELTDLFTFQADREIPAQAHLCLDSISKFFTLHLVQTRTKHDPVTARFCNIFDNQFAKTA